MSKPEEDEMERQPPKTDEDEDPNAKKMKAQEKKGWFHMPFQGGKKKEEEEKKKKEAEAKRQHKVKEEEMKKSKELADAKKAEQEETQREKEKKQRHQELLQRNLDPSRRVFQMHMKAIKLENLGEKPLRNAFIRVTLGGDYSEREEPGKGIVRRGKKGQVFQTHRAKRLKMNKSVFFRNEFGGGVPIYWMGSYLDLEMQEFVLECCRRTWTRRVVKMGEERKHLGAIAQGSIMQTFEFENEKTEFHVRIYFVIYFQELFVYQLRFVDWRGFSLKAADAPKRRKRIKLAEEAEAKKKRIMEARKERREARILEERERRARIRAERMEKQALAVARRNGNQIQPTGETGEGDGATGGGGEPTGAGGSSDDKAKLISGPTSDDGAKHTATAGAPWRFKKSTPEHRVKLTSRQLADVAAAKEEEKRRAKERREKMILQKIKSNRDKKQKKREEKAKREEEKAQLDIDKYLEPSSDPYIVFSIDKPINPGCKIFRHGGYFGRTVRTDMVPNSLNPTWEEARKPLAYLGTRSELENEILHIRVYDWDFLSADDLIGEAEVPLNGLLEYGQVEVELTLDEPDRTGKEVRGRKAMKTVPAGRLTGQILFDGKIPEYNQIGELVERKPNLTYLAVRINSATKLIPADPNGSSDPFVVIEWDGRQQSTRVINRTLEPVWNQTLYFPLKMVNITQAALEKKPPISVRVLDMDEAGHDLLGSCEIPLHKITSSEHARIEDELDMDGKPHKGRVLKLPAQKLDLPGHNIQSTLNLWVYFINDLPLDIHLEQPTTTSSNTLAKEYEQRAKQFISGLNPAVRGAIESAIKKQLGKHESSELDQDQLKTLVSATDQDGNEHLLCEYLVPIIPPLEMDTPEKVARMIRCITWSEDEETFKSDKHKDIWQSPPFFMEMRKGDMEDHALLMCNLLLGLGLDAYVCTGRLNDTKEFEKRHVWVLTRHDDGSVKMWETSDGSTYVLPNRWMDPATKAALNKKLEAVASRERGSRAFAKLKKTHDFADMAGGAALNMLKRGAHLATKVAAHAGDAGRGIIGAVDMTDEDHTGQKEAEKDAFDEGGSKKKSNIFDDDSLTQEMWNDVADDDELLARVDIEANMSEVVFGESILNDEDVQWPMRRSRRTEQKVELSDEYLSKILPEVSLPYGQLETMFNHQNLWVPRLHTDPAKITYDLEEDPFASRDDDRLSKGPEWDAFIDPRMRADGLPKPFYQAKRLASKPPADRLRAMEHQILSELKLQINYSRVGIPTIINKSAELEDVLKRGLELQELARIGDKAAKAELDTWSRECKSKLPPASTFRARVINYSYSDAKKIRKHLLSATDYATKQDEGTQFALAVKCFGFHGGICSVWVHFGVIDTDLLS